MANGKLPLWNNNGKYFADKYPVMENKAPFRERTTIVLSGARIVEATTLSKHPYCKKVL